MEFEDYSERSWWKTALAITAIVAIVVILIGVTLFLGGTASVISLVCLLGLCSILVIFFPLLWPSVCCVFLLLSLIVSGYYGNKMLH